MPVSPHVLALALAIAASALLVAAVVSRGRRSRRGRPAPERTEVPTSKDPLTGALDRVALARILTHALEHRAIETSAVAVYLIDLDGFGVLNARLGSVDGDLLLIGVAHRLDALVRAEDHVARLRDDAFVVVAPTLRSDADAHALGHKLLAALAMPFDLGGPSVCIGATIGYALAPVHASKGPALLRHADQAMREGKQAGGRTLKRFDPLAPLPAPTQLPLQMQRIETSAIPELHALLQASRR